MSHLGNKMQKGNCCGGFNFYNEDFIWAMFEAAYPRHHVQNVIPFMVSQTDDWDGIEASGLQVLYGQFTCNEDQSGILTLDMFDSSGVVHRYYENTGGTQNQTSAWMAAVEVNSNLIAPGGWQFVGWLVQLQGPIIEQGGLVLNVQQNQGGSYPIPVSLVESYNITPLSPVYSFEESGVLTLPLGVTSVKFSIDFFRLAVADTGDFETYTVTEMQKMWRCAEGTVTIHSVDNITNAKARVTLTVSNLFNPSTDCSWLADVALKLTSGSLDIDLDANGVNFLDEDDNLVAQSVVASAENSFSEGYTKGLALVRDRKITLTGTNAGPVADEAFYTPYGSPAVSMGNFGPGAVTITANLTASPEFDEILWRQPAIEVSCGIPA